MRYVLRGTFAWRGPPSGEERDSNARSRFLARFSARWTWHEPPGERSQTSEYCPNCRRYSYLERRPLDVLNGHVAAEIVSSARLETPHHGLPIRPARQFVQEQIHSKDHQEVIDAECDEGGDRGELYPSSPALC